jgi:CubicO group peptidase (beta-lactamase class C family)
MTRRTFLSGVALTAAVGIPGLAFARTRQRGRGVDAIAPAELAEMRALATTFMTNHNVPGLSMAIAKDGRLVFVEGLGLGNTEKKEPVTPAHLFRIASVSKPITSATIFALVEAGRVRLTDRIFGADSLLGTDFGRPPFKPHVAELTVQHLLTHTAGGWQNDRTDPMFSNPRMDHRALISWTIQNLPLTNAPGTRYAYSNFGYCVLGRVIEKLTATPYAASVQREVLSKCGVTAMRIAGNTLADRAPNEVVYYGQGPENPYGMQVARMDAHGGWLASPTDLVRFLVHVDGFPTSPDILQRSTIEAMTTASEANAGYAKGWSVNRVNNWWHNGSLPGTSTLMVRTSGGFCWAALANTRHPNSTMGADLDALMWNIVRKPTAWPAGDPISRR